MKNNININDLKIAYQYKTNKELKFTYYIFKILQQPSLLKLLTSCTNSILKYKLPLQFFIKNTVFKIFCAGESIDEAFIKINYLKKYDVKSVLDYVSEGEKNEKSFDYNTEIIVSNIIRLGKETKDNYVSVKISGLEDPEFLTICNGREFPKETIMSARFEKLMNRIDLICYNAEKSKVVLFIDAEDRCMQDILDLITEQMMEKYNKEYAVVFNTLQMYLKDRLKYLNNLIEDAERKKYIPGIKLVRGAYVEKEREAALKENRVSPVYDTKTETDNAFNKAIEICLQGYQKIHSCIATHNNESTLLAIHYIEKFGIANHFDKVRFSQLYGMSDNLTFNLGKNGFNTSKYLPYGEVKKAIPYLIRRSEENSSINGQINDEVTRLKNEIRRRKYLVAK